MVNNFSPKILASMFLIANQDKKRKSDKLFIILCVLGNNCFEGIFNLQFAGCVFG